jgi:hypothetical protein
MALPVVHGSSAHGRAAPWSKGLWRLVSRAANDLGMSLDLPSGKHTKNYGKSPFFMGKLTISMAIFNSYVTNYQRVVGFLNEM